VRAARHAGRLNCSNVVGRPGLDPGTLGGDRDDTTSSVDVRISWSEQVSGPPMSAEILSNLSLWLHDWLHKTESGGVGVILSTGPDGSRLELRVEVTGQSNRDRPSADL
jgi:hypothetical protein